MVYSFTFPAQDFKMRVDDEVLRAGTLEPAGEIFELDEDERRISLKLGPKWSRIADGASLIPKGPLGDHVLRGAIQRYAETVIAGETTRYRALTDIMKKSVPRLANQKAERAHYRAAGVICWRDRSQLSSASTKATC